MCKLHHPSSDLHYNTAHCIYLGALKEQDRSILTIQDRLSRLSKELYISSDQVTVLRGLNSGEHAPANVIDDSLTLSGSEEQQFFVDAERAVEVSLTSALEQIGTTSQDMSRSLELHRRTATVHAKELELRASKDTEVLAMSNKDHLDQIQQFLDSNMDVDLMDIRRNQDSILSQLEDYQGELDEKTTEEQVDTRIQSRYDELVTHLQIALRSVKDDEANFKSCIDRIESATGNLKTSKAERSELKELCVPVKMSRFSITL